MNQRNTCADRAHIHLHLTQRQVNVAREFVEATVLRAPTGKARELMTEANILIQQAISKLEEAHKELSNVQR